MGERMAAGTPQTATDSAATTGEQELLERVLAERAVRTVFQPLVELDSGAVVGFEALSRGPAGSPLERPDLLFAVARRHRRLRDLDVACRTAALQAGRAAGLRDPYRLFINAEPEALTGWRPAGHGDVPLTVILELTERALISRPAELLQSVAQVRALGWGIALDDIGADPASLALLPLVRPDVIKLDLRLVQQRPTAEIAAVVNAVHAEAERNGTLVLAEGLETEEHVRTARAFGATVGQGWFFGRPGPLPQPLPPFPGRHGLTVTPRADGSTDPSPFAVAVQAGRRVRAADKRLLIEVSKQLEAHAHAAGETAVVLAAFQEARFFTPATRRRYSDLAAACSFVAALGEGMPPEPLPGVRGAVLGPGDPVRGEWDIAVLGPHFAATLVARDLGDQGPDMQRRFEFVLSHDRELTVRVAAALMSRVWPESAVVDLPGLDGPSGQRAIAVVPAPRRGRASQSLPAGLHPASLRAALGVHLLERALDAATTGVTIADMRAPDQPLVWVNEAFTALSGYPLAEVLGRNCRFLQGPGSDRRTVAELGAALQQGRQVDVRLLNYRRDGVPWWNDLVLCPVHDERGQLTHYIGVQNDVTARYEAEQRVLHLAYSDTLTGLANRARLSSALDETVERTRRTGTAAALLFLDLDDFKRVNDSHGHSAGDELLRHVAGRLRSAVRADDLLARQGGDEFLLLLSDLPTTGAAATAHRVAADVIAALSQPFDLGGQRVTVGASIGISIAPDDAASAKEMLRHADTAMYAAKRAGRHRAQLYSTS